MSRTAIEVQQEFAEDLGENRSIIWDLYETGDKNALAKKLKTLIPDYIIDVDRLTAIELTEEFPPEKINKLLADEFKKAEKENAKIEKCRTELLNSIWAQRKYCNGDLLMSIIFVLVAQIKTDKENDKVKNEENEKNEKTKEKEKEQMKAHIRTDKVKNEENEKNKKTKEKEKEQQMKALTIEEVLHSTNYSCHPVFRVRKCIHEKDGKIESTGCCMIFIDETGRVYQDWDDYRTNNVLPDGIMISPEGGIYSFDSDFNPDIDTDRKSKPKVKLYIDYTPSSSMTTKVLQRTDTTLGVVGLGAAMIPLGALALPVAAPILAGSAIVAAASGLWCTGRSVAQLFDRGTHKQSIDPISDRRARGAWIGTVGGVFGLGAGGATFGFARYAASGGNITKIAQVTLNGLNIASLITNGLGVGNGVLELILKATVDDEDISSTDLLQLAASLALFTHSVYNFQYASNIAKSAREGKINGFREGLSKRQRKMFNKMYKETIRVRGETQGKIDVVRALDNIPDNKYFNDMYKVNKNLNKENIRSSFSPDGKVLLNNDIAVDSATLRSNIQNNNVENLLTGVGSVPTAHSSSTPRIVNASVNFDPHTAFGLIQMVTSGISSAIKVLSSSNLEKCICNLCETFVEEVVSRLITITDAFIQKYGQEIEERLGQYLPFEIILWKLYTVVVDMYREEIHDFKTMTVEFLNEHALNIITKLRSAYEALIERRKIKNPKSCTRCKGIYSITILRD